jgi:hypothetical protein
VYGQVLVGARGAAGIGAGLSALKRISINANSDMRHLK